MAAFWALYISLGLHIHLAYIAVIISCNRSFVRARLSECVPAPIRSCGEYCASISPTMEVGASVTFRGTGGGGYQGYILSITMWVFWVPFRRCNSLNKELNSYKYHYPSSSQKPHSTSTAGLVFEIEPSRAAACKTNGLWIFSTKMRMAGALLLAENIS